jgi:hypothetical protein
MSISVFRHEVCSMSITRNGNSDSLVHLREGGRGDSKENLT